MNKITLKIEGMACQACVARVTIAIEKVDGARAVAVSVGQATVDFDEQRTSAAAVVDAVTQAGYPASGGAS